MKNLRDLIVETQNAISGLYPEWEAREMVFLLFESLIETSRHTHIIEPDFVVNDIKVQQVKSAVERLAKGEPLQYVLGYAHFYGREFRVSPDVLIPRQETELLCRKVIEEAGKLQGSPLKVLDLCTGSGCIAWTLALELPGAQVTAVDISDGALSVASSQDFSDEMLRTGALKPTFIKVDVLKGPGAVEMSDFDVIVSNPPYVRDSEKALMRSNVLDHEPHLALFVPDEDPLIFYRAVADWASVLLVKGGLGMVEINEAFGNETAECFAYNKGFSVTEVISDLSDKERFIFFKKQANC